MLNINDAYAILAVSINEPEILFNQEFETRKRLIELTKIWHPDVNPNKILATKVMAHITELYNVLKNKVWIKPKSIIIAMGSRKFAFNYLRKHCFDGGMQYIGSERVIFMLDPDLNDILDNALNIKKYWKLDGALKTEFSSRLPVDFKMIRDEDSNKAFNGMMIEKDEKLLLLRDVLEYFVVRDRSIGNGKMPIAHVCWIISELMNFSCWLEHCDIAHNAIDLDSCYINPETHSLALIGGWCYSKVVTDKLTVLPERTLEVVPEALIKPNGKYIANSKSDRYLIRRLASELMGDPSGYSFIHDKTFPKPIENWLNMGVPDSATDDFQNWYKVLEKAFGKRKFTELKLSQSDIYK